MATSLTKHPYDPQSEARLARSYVDRLIPAEKKPFLLDLRQSAGPYMAVANGDVICDGASQIASLGMGFNPSAFFGVAQYIESWTNDGHTDTCRALRRAWTRLLQRKLDCADYHVNFVASGAEAVETTLAYFFDRRKHAEAYRVLSFEGSFHGRMMVALSATWNPAKREPFSWPGYEACFAQYPEMDDDRHDGPVIPKGWRSTWTAESDVTFARKQKKQLATDDQLLQHEIEALTEVREHLREKKVFAILIEPMQCEGGDRYASSRFHQGLAYLSETFDVPLVYDEIQTGFGLGGIFFWHRLFDLKNRQGGTFYPNGVICAKKAQVGLSIVRDESRDPIDSHNSDTRQAVSVASMIRGYIQGSVIDQFEEAILRIEEKNRDHLEQLVDKYAPAVRRPRVKGLSFAFDMDPPEKVAELVAQRFAHGLLYYPAGKKTARFRLNLAFREPEMELFWQQLDAALAATLTGERPENEDAIHVDLPSTTHLYNFHEQFATSKLMALRNAAYVTTPAVDYLLARLRENWPDRNVVVKLLTADNFADYRERILALQETTYEPVRRSSAEEFDQLFRAERPLGLMVLDGDEIVGMAFAGPLHLFTNERGVEIDPHRNDPNVAYMLDLTIVARFRGGLGAPLKQAITLLAQQNGYSAIHGRNRDRLAAGMWSINLSLGAYETRHLSDDYPDDQPYRDCFYYRLPTTWTEPPINLSSGVESPVGLSQLDESFLNTYLPNAVNKITLSNFVNERFLDHLEHVARLFPRDIRHIYTANGLSEAIDKVVKVLWKHRQPHNRAMTFEQNHFGSGSFMSRSLSAIGHAYFCVQHMPLPFLPSSNESNDSFDWSAFETQLESGEWLGVFIEPLMGSQMIPWPTDVLERVVQTCRQYGVPVIFNETASQFYRYQSTSFSASGIVCPDASVVYLGGQMAMAFVSDNLFLEEPLLLISTWEGDAFSLAQYATAVEALSDVNVEETVHRFQDTLAAQLHAAGADASRLIRGCGPIFGDVPAPWEAMIPAVVDEARICCPTIFEMQRFLDWNAS